MIDLHAKNQVNICKRLGKKSGKLILTDGLTDGLTDELTDGLTERKPKVPFGLAGRGLKRYKQLQQMEPTMKLMATVGMNRCQRPQQINPFQNKPRFIRVCSTSLKNIVGKRKIACNDQFLIFPQCFLLIWRTFYHFHQI